MCNKIFILKYFLHLFHVKNKLQEFEKTSNTEDNDTASATGNVSLLK